MSKLLVLALSVLLAASFGLNYFLYRDVWKLAEDKAAQLADIARLNSELDYRLKERQRHEELLKEYQDKVNQISAQRDYYRRQTQEALKHDAELAQWAATRLPVFVTDTLKRLREERSKADNGGKQTATGFVSRNPDAQ